MVAVKIEYNGSVCLPVQDCMFGACQPARGWRRKVPQIQLQKQPYISCLQASKGLEKKGAKLHQIQLQEQAKLDKAEERMEARAAAKRQREEEKQAEKAELKRYAACGPRHGCGFMTETRAFNAVCGQLLLWCLAILHANCC